MKKGSMDLRTVLCHLGALIILGVVASFVHFSLSVQQFIFLAMLAFALWYTFCSKRAGRFSAVVIAGGVCAFTLAMIAVIHMVFPLAIGVNRRALADGQADFFARRTLILLPHEDDELCILGGVIERIPTDDVWVAFVTNGDCNYGRSDERLKQALSALRVAKIPEEHVIFLGYGDQWATDYGHIYFAPEDEIVTSAAGQTQTYALDGTHPPFAARDYTRGNLVSDLKALMLMLQAEVIYCVDQDAHCDHHALSLLFEEAVGELLHEQRSFCPVIYKGFAYSTSLYQQAASDWENIPSTHNPYDTPYMAENSAYLWQARVRLPASRMSAVRMSQTGLLTKMLRKYDTQIVFHQASSILRGDKVFWRRYTDGIYFGTSLTVSSGDGGALRDFKLSDHAESFFAGEAAPTAGVWVPDGDDETPTCRLTFGEEQELCSVALYDNPSLLNNVLNATLVFSDGSAVETGPLPPNGSMHEVAFSARKARWVSVVLTEVEGRYAGLTELEAYAAPHPQERAFVKLVDGEENFAFSYWLPDGENATLGIYEYGMDGGLPLSQRYRLTTTGGVTAVWEHDAIRITCPRGAVGSVRIHAANDPSIYDEISVANPSAWYRQMVLQLNGFYGWLQDYYTHRNWAAQLAYYRQMARYLLDKF